MYQQQVSHPFRICIWVPEAGIPGPSNFVDEVFILTGALMSKYRDVPPSEYPKTGNHVVLSFLCLDHLPEHLQHIFFIRTTVVNGDRIDKLRIVAVKSEPSRIAGVLGVVSTNMWVKSRSAIIGQRTGMSLAAGEFSLQSFVWFEGRDL